ncbi:MAG: S41 family peptidase [Pseudomonadota bacterium]
METLQRHFLILIILLALISTNIFSIVDKTPAFERNLLKSQLYEYGIEFLSFALDTVNKNHFEINENKIAKAYENSLLSLFEKYDPNNEICNLIYQKQLINDGIIDFPYAIENFFKLYDDVYNDQKYNDFIIEVLNLYLKNLDSHSMFFSECTKAEFSSSKGFAIKMVDDGFEITYISVISPFHGKILKGDIILSINELKSNQLTLTSFNDMIDNEDTIKFKIRRNGKEFQEVISKSGFIDIEFFEKYNTSYIKIKAFSDGLFDSFVSKVSTHEEALRKHEGLIIDLRNNPGGYIEEALKVASLFIKENDALLLTKIYSDISLASAFDNIKVYKEIEYWDIFEDKKIIVLVNQNTASSAEIFSGILKDYDLALIAGKSVENKTTFGKGSFQNGIMISKKNNYLNYWGMLLITKGFYYLPSGHSPQNVGIIADISLNLDAQDSITIDYSSDHDTADQSFDLKSIIHELNEIINEDIKIENAVFVNDDIELMYCYRFMERYANL